MLPLDASVPSLCVFTKDYPVVIMAATAPTRLGKSLASMPSQRCKTGTTDKCRGAAVGAFPYATDECTDTLMCQHDQARMACHICLCQEHQQAARTRSS